MVVRRAAGLAVAGGGLHRGIGEAVGRPDLHHRVVDLPRQMGVRKPRSERDPHHGHDRLLHRSCAAAAPTAMPSMVPAPMPMAAPRALNLATAAAGSAEPGIATDRLAELKTAPLAPAPNAAVPRLLRTVTA